MEFKEEFCAPCAMAVPTLLGAGGIAGSSTTGGNRKMKTIIFWSSIGVTILSVIIYIWLKNRCSTCR